MTEAEEVFVGGGMLRRPADRVEWFTGADGRRYITSFGEMERYSPSEEATALNATLANLELDEESIADFVKRYGFLGVGESTGLDEWDYEYGECLDTWRVAVGHYRAIWGEVNGKPQLGSVLVERLTEADEFLASMDDALRAYRFDLVDANQSPLSTTGNVVEGALIPSGGGVVAVRARADEQQELGAARDRVIAIVLSGPLGKGVGATVKLAADGDGATVAYEPKTLLAHCYLALANDFAYYENVVYGRCQECGTDYRQDVRHAADQKGCASPRCRQKRYERNRDEAWRLSTVEKMTVAKIAKAMDADKSQVERWLAAAAKRKGGGKR